MKEIYIATGIETIIILIVAIIVNQILHRLFSKIKIDFITPILNIFIVIWFLLTYRGAINKLGQLPNVHFPIDASKLFMAANIIAGILTFLFIVQSIGSLIHSIKLNKKEKLEEVGTEELPMFKPDIDFSQKEEKNYPLPSEINIEPKEEELIPNTNEVEEKTELPLPNRQRLKRRN